MRLSSTLSIVVFTLIVATASSHAVPLQTWTIQGTIEDFNDFNILQGSNAFSVEILVDPDTPDLSPDGRAGFYAATATLTLGTIHETFGVEIAIIGNGSSGDSLQVTFQPSSAPRPAGWTQWSFSVNFRDTTNALPFTGELPTFPLTLNDFDQSNGAFFAINDAQNASLLGTLVVTGLQTPEPTSLALLTLGTLALITRRAPRKSSFRSTG